MNLTTHFTDAELTIRKKVPGVDLPRLYPEARASLTDLCGVLERIREQVGEAVHVTSGFRSGDPKQHGRGQAADIQVRSMSPIGVMRVIYGMGLPGVRQVIAESMHRDRLSLSQPMIKDSGLWVHVAIHGPGFERAASMPWGTSVAPPEGQDRAYVRWVP